jgi:ribonucleoside-diphosphate reductase beta chain
LQKPEIANACFTFAGNEVVHQLAYQKLLDKLGLFERFSHIMEVEAMQGRVRYLNRYLEGVSSRSNKEFTKSLILFTLMTENVSLFSQFLIMSSFFKYENIFPNFSKIVTATGRDEILHGRFGSSLINIIRNENPEWFDDEMEEKIRRNIRKAYRAEKKVLDWIFENGELPWISKTEVEEYLKSRFNDSLDQIGYEKEFDLSKDLLKRSDYMDVLMMSSVDFDFFAGRGIDYAKNKAFSEDSLWD